MSSHNWRVIATDDFDRENVSDRELLTGLSEEAAKMIARILNADSPFEGWFHKAVDSTYKLYKFEP